MKARHKVNALAKISSLMRFEQRKRIVNSFIFLTSNTRWFACKAVDV